MATETKQVTLSPSYGPWIGKIDATIHHDAQNEKITVDASMRVYETVGGSPIEGVYRFQLYINVDGNIIASSGNPSNPTYLWLTESGYTTQCSATFDYTDACKVTVGGWGICDEGVLAGQAVQGSGTWNYEACKPPTEIVTDKDSVEMKSNLLFTLNRAYGSYTHKLYYKFGSGSETLIASNVGSSYGWTVPDMANLCANAVSGSCTLRAETYDGSTLIGQTTKTITITVPGATTAAIAGSEVTMGTSSTIQCPRKSQYFTIRLEYVFYNTTVKIAESKADSVSWKPGYDLAKQIPALTAGTGTLRCTTLNGTAVVGTKTTTIRAKVPDNTTTRPSFTLSGLTLSPVSSLGSAFAGLYLRGKTGLKAEFNASSAYSTIKSYSITVGSLSASGNPATISLLINEGTVKVTAKVTDARGYSTTVSTTIYILPYRKPKVTPYTGYSDIVCERALANGELSPSGTYLAIKAGKSFSSVVVNGAERNQCVLRYRWKLSGAASFSAWITLLEQGSTALEISTLIGNVCADLAASYTVELSVADTLGGENTLTFAIMTEAVSFVLYDGEDGAGFGKYPEAPHVVDIASHMTLRVRGQLVVDRNAWKSLGFASGVSESVYALGRREDSDCSYQVVDGSHVYVAFNGAFSYDGTSVRVNETLIPKEYRPKRTVYALCPVNGRAMAQVCVGSSGTITVQWVQAIPVTASTATYQVSWIDGYLDYWI